jgi:hypothetical protein
MKHIKPINEYFSNINEGVNYNAAHDANLEEVGYNLLQGTGQPWEDKSKDDLKKIAIEALKKANPFPLSGKIKEDLPKLVKYIKDSFSAAGVSIDDSGVEISRNMGGDNNEILIPVEGQEDYFVYTSLDYYELVSQGEGINLFAAFYSDEEGMLDFNIANLDNRGSIVKACAEFKKYLQNQK